MHLSLAIISIKPCMHAIMSSFKVMFHDHKVLLNQNHENNWHHCMMQRKTLYLSSKLSQIDWKAIV